MWRNGKSLGFEEGIRHEQSKEQQARRQFFSDLFSDFWKGSVILASIWSTGRLFRWFAERRERVAKEEAELEQMRKVQDW